MKFRTPHPEPTDESERQAEERLRTTLRDRGYSAPDPLPDPVRSAMLVRTNDRIDRATSGRALSLSWAMRVAVPGAFAIIAFFIGLHYYGTPVEQAAAGLTPILDEISDAALDSLMEAHAVVDSTALTGDAPGGLFDIPGDAAEEYLLSTNRTDILAETLQDRELNEVLAVLAGARGATF